MIKHLITTLIYLPVIAIGFMASSCTQTIIEKDRFQINTFLMTSGMESLYYDPAGIFEVGKYRGVPSNLKIRVNQYTGQLEIVAEKGDTDGN